jgi:hypothetical protein
LSDAGPHGYPNWLLRRAGFSDATIATYHKMRIELHWRTADDLAEAFLLLMSFEQDKLSNEEFLPGT